jgi:hypothetical protein
MGERDKERRQRQRDNNAEKDSKLADQTTVTPKIKKTSDQDNNRSYYTDPH